MGAGIAGVVIGGLSVLGCPPLALIGFGLGAWAAVASVRLSRADQSWGTAEVVPGAVFGALAMVASVLGFVISSLYCGACSYLYSLIAAVALIAQ